MLMTPPAWLLKAMRLAAETRSLLAKQAPPQPRSRSHAGAHYPRHSHNRKGYFARRSGEGLRETHRRRVGNLGTFRKEAEMWLR